jgi:hypothetical protein
VEIIEAYGTTAIISSMKNAEIELSVVANVGPKDLDLANIKLNFTVISQSGIETKLPTVADPNLTPLFKTGGIVDPFGRPPQFDWLKATKRQKTRFKLRYVKSFDTFVSSRDLKK